MKKIEKLNLYLSNLAVLNVKLHNLHWNVVGKNFVQLHEFTESQYDDVFEKFDDVAELIKINGHKPLASLSSYLKNSSIKELESKDFSDNELIDIVEADLKEQLELVKNIREIADKEDDFTTVAMMEEHANSYKKTLWFIIQIKG